MWLKKQEHHAMTIPWSKNFYDQDHVMMVARLDCFFISSPWFISRSEYGNHVFFSCNDEGIIITPSLFMKESRFLNKFEFWRPSYGNSTGWRKKILRFCFEIRDWFFIITFDVLSTFYSHFVYIFILSRYTSRIEQVDISPVFTFSKNIDVLWKLKNVFKVIKEKTILSRKHGERRKFVWSTFSISLRAVRYFNFRLIHTSEDSVTVVSCHEKENLGKFFVLSGHVKCLR